MRLATPINFQTQQMRPKSQKQQFRPKAGLTTTRNALFGFLQGRLRGDMTLFSFFLLQILDIK